MASNAPEADPVASRWWSQVTSVEVVHDDGPRLAVHVREPQRLAVPQRGRDTAPEARSRIAQHGTPLLVDLTCLAASEEELVDAFARFGVRTTGTGDGAVETLHAARPARHTARKKALAVVGWTLPVAGAVVLTVLLSILTAGGFDGVITGDSAWEPMVASLCLLVVGAGWLAHLFGTMPHHHLPSGSAVSVDASGFRRRTSASTSDGSAGPRSWGCVPTTRTAPGASWSGCTTHGISPEGPRTRCGRGSTAAPRARR
ncbi:hypothetical protein UQW22_04105 [Isoptericola halotolerans]|uniref:hypothetical protein n=1 Tax=Isoptericola halotolerans TaxID=300560 RepID=UPI00388E1D70